MDLLWVRDGKVHDLVFVNGECPTTRGRTDSVAQRLYLKLRTFQGEWFLNEDHGVPWLEDVLGKKVKTSTVDMIIQNAILSTSGVKKIETFSSSFDNPNRVYECRFTFISDVGERSEEIII